ncbi:MAG: class I adenylate cyclase, partial [Planctomycetes bacterium]|nr:class I adenylate cyclase [Planctomycetota bacterium]
MQESLDNFIRNAYRAFLLFTQAKRRECFKDFTEGQKEAFLLIPHMLHTQEPRQLALVEGRPAPCGIYGHRHREEVKEIGRMYFSPTDRFEEPRQVAAPVIESLSIMGSAGSIAQTEGSDLDYWVCIRKGLSTRDRASLKEKLVAIEKWCMTTLNAEVHFFISTMADLRDNNFGAVDKESCGTALGKLLKEEYYRSSLHVMGKIPLWWMAPCGASDEVYEKIPDRLGSGQRSASTTADVTDIRTIPRDDFIDFGNISSIPSDEFIGGGMWQLNKGVGSPFKSALKMALLIEYADPSRPRELLAQMLKRRMLENPGDMDSLDPYRMMVERVISFHVERGERSQALLLQRCLFLKMHINVSRYWASKRPPNERATCALLAMVKLWGWSLKDVEKWENFDLLSMSELNRFKHDLENYMFNSLQALRASGGEFASRAVSAGDFRKMTQRLATIFNPDPRRIEWYYPPYAQLINSPVYSIQEEPNEKDWIWNLYTGLIDAEGGESAVSAKRLLRSAPTAADLITWMLYNQLIRPSTRLFIVHRRDIPFAGNLRRLCAAYSEFIGQPSLPSLDDDAFAQEPRPVKCLMVVNLIPFLAVPEADAPPVLEEADSPEQSPDEAAVQEPPKTAPLGEGSGGARDASLIAGELAEALSDAGYENKAAELITKVEEVSTEEQVTVGGKTLPLRAGRVPTQEDPFNAGPAAASVYRDVFLIELNSWGEVHVHRMQSAQPVAHAIQTLVQRSLRSPQERPEIRCEIGLGPYHINPLRRGFSELVETMMRRLILCERPHAVGILRIDGEFIAIIRFADRVEYKAFGT